jgi:U11/U12 small nuclear ribonucleoprotein SNRNP25
VYTTLDQALDDPVLKDVPQSPTVADIDKLIAVEMGSAMKLTVQKLDGTSIEVAVLNSADVRDLKRAIEKVVNEKTAEEMGQRSISWSHVWGNFALAFKGQRFLDDDASLRNFGLRHNDTIEFVHHIPSKEAGEHSQAKKTRFFHSISTRLLR